jgi:subtilisin-like proprotein convertase family protein
VFGDSALSLVDTNGHGTHVAGIIAGSGLKSITVTNASGSIMPGTNGQFRGKAPLATLYSVAAINNAFTFLNVSDQYLQEAAALTNALISNNSWNYGGSSYDLEAASYDAAVRDALPEVTGSQPVLFVFSAGNSGGGGDDGTDGGSDTILSPATAKNVITVGALEQLRNITNVVTNLDGSVSTPWQPMTDSSNQVASYSSRGNVGIGIEGTYGRFKPDVVAPGTFVVSTRSGQWDTNAYYNPTNVTTLYYSDQVVVDTNTPNYYPLVDLSTTPNAVGVTIQIVPNILSPTNLNLPVYFSQVPDPNNYPDPTNDTGSSAFFVETNLVTIPSDGGSGYLAAAVASGGFNYVVGDSGAQSVGYDLIQEIFTTNDLGNYYQVLEGMNDSLGTSPEYYRYETGTSMAAADVSGVLALMQDFFTNQWKTLPTPALLKAMLINGARQTWDYNFEVNVTTPNAQGWGLINLTNALQHGITSTNGVGCSTFILDQNPTNALATGDSQTFYVSVTNASAQFQPLRITLAWTDPPGDPAAAIKLVNDLNLVVTNLDDPTNPIIYYGNDITSSDTFNTPETTNTPPVFDSINNVENVYISPLNGTNFSVTVVGYRVNVNAVTAQTNNFAGNYAPNVVQDYALVISSGNGSVTNAMTVTANQVVSNPTSDQQITYVSGTNGTLLNQFVGANTPLMGTNAFLLTNSVIVSGETNWQITIGMTNQWHFYVVINTTGFTNAAFVTYNPDTLSIPRMGVFADSQANATRPEADIDLYVASGPTAWGLTNLNPTIIFLAASNYLASVSGPTPNVFATVTPGNTFQMASLGRGGTEYVVDTNSQQNEVYYVGVKSEDQMASEYGFLPVFSRTPFSEMTNGNEIATGNPAPVLIPDGNPAVPGYTDVVALAIYPIHARSVVISNTFNAQDFGDLVGAVNHNSTSVILNNHDSVNSPGTYTFFYDDSGQGNIANSQPSDGPGSLNSFVGQDGTGVWILHEADNAVGFTNAVESFNSMIEPHQADSGSSFHATIAGCEWYYDYIDVPPGATNLTIAVTNQTGTAVPPLELFVKYGSAPTTSDFDEMTNIDQAIILIPPEVEGAISIGPPLASGRYFFGVYNPCGNENQTFSGAATYLPLNAVPGQLDYASAGPVPILDDAVTTNSIFVPDNATIYSVDVGLRVDHPRISDLVFHLISPDGTRVLLVENRGGTSTNGMGGSYAATNTTASASGGPGRYNTIFDTGFTSGTLTIDYTFYSVSNEMVVSYQDTNIFDTGLTNIGSGVVNFPYAGTSTQVKIVINPANNSDPSMSWAYAANETVSRYSYLVLTEDTNKTTTPIKFAPPPFIPTNTAPPIPPGVTVLEGPIFSPVNGHAYYLLGTNTWTGSEAWATNLGGHLATIRNAKEQNWVFNTFSGYGGVARSLWIGLYDTNQDSECLGDEPSSPDGGLCHSNNFGWVSGESITYTDWTPGEPNNCGGSEYYTFIWGWGAGGGGVGDAGKWNDEDNFASDCSAGDYDFLASGVVEVTNLNSSITSPDLYYLPEQSLDTFARKNAQGPWQLEVQDDRAGASNNTTLVSWQLRFTYTTASGTGTLINGVPATNSIPSGSIVYYSVAVPTSADYATNILLFATGPLNLLFNPSNFPTGTNTGDYTLIAGQTSGLSILNTNSVPPLVPGETYYLGVQNTNSFSVNFGLEVNFHLIPTTNTYKTAGTYSWTCPPGVFSVTVECWGGGGGGCSGFPIVMAPPSFGVGGGGGGAYSKGTNVAVIPGTVYTFVVGGGGGTNANGTNSIFASTTNIIVAMGGSGAITNTVALGGQASAGIGNVKYSGGNGGTGATPCSGGGGGGGAGNGANGGIGGNGSYNGISCTGGAGGTGGSVGGGAGGSGWSGGAYSPGGPGNLGTQPGGGGAGASEADSLSEAGGLGAAGEVRLTYTTIGVATSLSISGASVTSSSAQLQWEAPTDAQFQVEWATNLSQPMVWMTNDAIITATNGVFNFTDPGATNSPMRFYRLLRVQ